MAVSVKLSPNLLANLKLYQDSFDEKVKYKVSQGAAKPLSEKAKENVVVSSKPHNRTKNGKVIATYYPGNLKRSIRVIKFKKNSTAYVGPKISGKGSGTGDFKGARVDGWYGHFIEYGTPKQAAQPYMRPAYESTKNEVTEKLIKGFTDEFKKVRTK